MTLRYYWLTRELADLDRQYQEMLKENDLIIKEYLQRSQFSAW